METTAECFSSKSTCIPREEHEHGSDGDFSNKAFKSLFCFAVSILECFVADLEQIFGSLDGRRDFLARESDWATHLDGQLLGELGFMADELLEEFFHDFLTLLESGLAERLERLGGDLGQEIEVGGRGTGTGNDGLVCVGRNGSDGLYGHDGRTKR